MVGARAGGQLEPAVILRVRDAAILDTLQANPDTALSRRAAGRPRGAGARRLEEFRRVTASLGLLLDAADDDGE